MSNKFKPTTKILITLVFLIILTSGYFGSIALAEGGEDYRIFLRYADSTVTETSWEPTKSWIIYKGRPATHEERYRVIPCVVRMPNGTIIALVEPGGSKPIFICSTDGAKTWSKPYQGILLENVKTVSTLGVRCDGRLMAVSEKPMRLIYSSDQGRTWEMGSEIASSPMNSAWVWTGGRILELDDGTLVVPVAGYLQAGWLSSGVLISNDDGKNWNFSIIGYGNPSNMMIFSEPAVAKMDDGGLVALMRTEDRVSELVPGEPRGERTGLYRANSWDGGKTWSSPVETLTGSHCSVVQLPDGILLCGYHRSPRLALSSDSGRSWYANMLWITKNPRADWGWYTSVEVVDQTTALVLIKEMQTPNTIQACLLYRQPQHSP